VTATASAGSPAAAEAAREPVGAGSRERPPGEPRLVGYLYLLPAFVVFALFVLAPLAHAAYISLFNWDGLTVGTWAGLSNYGDVFSDPGLRSSFAHGLVLIVFYAVLPLLIGLLLAGVMARARVRGLAFFRTILFLPQVIAMVVVAVMWSMIYDPSNGALNRALGWFGISGKAWLGDFTWALPSVGLIGTWVYYGLAMVLLTAGVQKIPSSLYDAARVDGAGPFREFLAVTLPGLRGELAVALTLTIIFALRSFDLIYVATAGGPGTSTTVPSYLVYQNAFSNGRVGLAAAVAVVLTIIIFAVAFLVTRVVERDARA
jgi:raffinose/stachyose/melibiose transport system permease protein